MQRVLVLLLSALDAVVAAAVGLAVAGAPLTVFWFVAFGSGDLSAIWQSAGTIWQFGHSVPVAITLPDVYVVELGVDPTLASFTLSLAPLAFAAFTLLFGGRSGARAGRAGAPWSGALTGTLVFAALAAGIAVTSQAPLAGTDLWRAICYPTAYYAAGVLAGALHRAWIDGDDGPVDALRARLDRARGAWPEVPELAVRGTAIAVTGLVAVGAAVLALGLIVRAPNIVALSQAGNLDAGGAAVLALAQLLYLPTLLVWALSFVAGPGVGLGAGSVVSPAGTQLGVLPGVPILGVLPEGASSWYLLLALLPIAVGAVAGWATRSRLSPRGSTADAESTGILVTLTLSIAALAALATALMALLASGSMGPGRLSAVGPDALAVGVAVGVEVGLGAAILLLSPRRRSDEAAETGSDPGVFARLSGVRGDAGDAPERTDAARD